MSEKDKKKHKGYMTESRKKQSNNVLKKLKEHNALKQMR